MPRKTTLIAALLLLISNPVPAQPPGLVAKQFAELFAQHIRDRRIPGGAFAVVSKDAIVHIATEGHTRIGGRQAIDPDTVFRLASVSKTFAAGLAGMLVQEGKLNWQDSVVQHVPGFRIQGNTGRIQLQHILGQSSGLVPHAYDNLIEDGWAVQDIYREFRKLQPTCVPGRCYSYQNSLYSLVEPVIENATGQQFETLVSRKLFQPLGMDNASIGYRAFVDNPNRARPHKRRSGNWQPVDVQPTYYRVPSAAGVNASITDMAHWVMAQMGARPDVIGEHVIDDLTRPRIQTKREFGRRYWRDVLTNAHYGLGWRIYTLGPERIVYHGGWVAGFRADIAYSKKHDIGLVILLNAETGSISELSTRFWDLVF